MDRSSSHLQQLLFKRALSASMRGLLVGLLCSGLLFTLWFDLRSGSALPSFTAELWLFCLSVPILAPSLVPLGALVGTLTVLEDLTLPPHAQLLQSLGASPWTWSRPLLLSACCLGTFGLGSGIWLEHAAWREARLALIDVEQQALEAQTQTAALFHPAPGWMLLKLPGSRLTLLAQPEPRQALWISSAQAQLHVDARARTLRTRLNAGALLQLDDDGPLNAGTFDVLELSLPLETALGRRPLAELAGEALLERLDSADRRGRGGQLEVLTLHRRLSQPLCALAFCLLACGLRARLRRATTGPWAAAGLTLIVWYSVQRATDTLAVTWPSEPATFVALGLLAWSPVVVPSVLGWALLTRAEHSL